MLGNGDFRFKEVWFTSIGLNFSKFSRRKRDLSDEFRCEKYIAVNKLERRRDRRLWRCVSILPS